MFAEHEYDDFFAFAYGIACGVRRVRMGSRVWFGDATVNEGASAVDTFGLGESIYCACHAFGESDVDAAVFVEGLGFD